MAGYREFRSEKYYDAPNMGQFTQALVQGAQNSAEAIGNIFRSMAEQKAAKRKAADAYKFDLGAGKFENDDKIFHPLGLNITARTQQDLRTNGKISPERQKEQEQAVLWKKESDWQYAQFQDNAKRIEGVQDKYFDKEYEHNRNYLAANGENRDIDFRTRGERLDAYDKVIFKDPKSFRGKLYNADYVANFRAKEDAKATGDPTKKSSRSSSTPFVNEQGAEGVTVTHAKEYLSSRGDGMVSKWVESLVDADMDADVAYNKQRNTAIAKMDDETARLYLKANPEENQLNKKDYATRVIEKAQEQLRESAAISKKTDYETKSDQSITNGLYKNDKISQGFTSHVDEPLVSGGTNIIGPSGQFGVKLNIPRNNMPGANLRQGPGAKVGQAIPIPINPRNSYNIRNGQNSRNIGTTSFNVQGYQLGAYTKDGKYVPIDKDNLDKMPNSAFKNLQPTLQTSLRGFTLDKSNSLGELASHESNLNSQYAEAVSSNDVDKQTQIQAQLDAVEELKKSMNLKSADFSEEDLINAYRRTGIATANIQRDVIVQASDADKRVVEQITQGLNIDDKSKWDDDMLNTDSGFSKRYQEAAAAGFQDQKTEKAAVPTPKPAAQQKAAVPTITSDADYAKLPVGATYQYTDSYGNLKTTTKKK
jgi:hypothetical protein